MPQSTAGRVLLSMIAATCVTLITNVLDKSPTVSLVGAALAALVPALITAGGWHGLTLGLGVTAAALGVTYFGFTAVDVTTDRPLTFPAPKRVEEQLDVTVSTETGETETGETETGETETGGGTVEGDAAAGEQVFASNGCGSCHTFEPAGSSGTTGPDLDELSALAEATNQPVADFTRTSITDPSAYVEEGFPEGVMPAYEQLSEEDLNNLVAFLTQS